MINKIFQNLDKRYKNDTAVECYFCFSFNDKFQSYFCEHSKAF